MELPPLVLPEKGNPKLDSQLNKLANDKPKGPALFSPQSMGKSEGKMVRVIVESLPGKSEEARLEAGAHGTIETTYGGLTQMMVPVAQLNALADNPNIRLVREPMEPVFEAVTSEGVALLKADDW